jgi:rubredoxin
MRIMTAHVTSDEYIDYYECSKCGWVYPFPRLVKEEHGQLPNEEAAKTDFKTHDCTKYPRAMEVGRG